MKKTNKFLSVFLALLMIISIIPMSITTASAADVEKSGTCGANLTWTFNESTGTLTISGTGTMNNYLSSNRPWESYERSIVNVVINNGVKTIGNYAFYYCDNLTSIIIPDSVTTIGERAFAECDDLTFLIIPDSVTTIGEWAFGHCHNLSSIIIGNSVTIISNYAFAACWSLTGVIIPNSVTVIGNCAFNGCESLTSVTIPASVTTIGKDTFSHCYKLNNVYYSGTKEQWNKIVGDSGLNSDVIHYNSSGVNGTGHNHSFSANLTEPTCTEQGYTIFICVCGYSYISNYIAAIGHKFVNGVCAYCSETMRPDISYEMQDGLYVFSDNMSMSYMVDDVIFLAVSQLNNGGYSIPEKLSITFLDSTVVELIDTYDYKDIESGKYSANLNSFPEEFKSCKFIVLNAKKEGMTEFVLTNNDTNDTFRSYLMVSEDSDASYRADKVGTRINRGEEYNFVVNGIVISDFKYTRTTGGYDFEMNAYNSKYSLGVVEVYNADGTLRQVEKIDKFSSEDNVVGVFAEGWYLVKDFFEGELITFKQDSTNKKTHIRVFVPQEGYIRVSNDSAVSTSCFILNLFDVISSSGGVVSGTSSLSESQIDILDKKILEKFIFNTFYMETAKRYQENLKNLVAENVTESVLLSLITQAGDIAEGLLKDIDLSFEDICREALGTAASIGEEIFTKVTGVYGATLGAMMNSRTVINYANQMRDWAITIDKQGYYGIKTPYNANYDSGVLTSGDGIEVDTNGNVASEVILQTVRILKDNSITAELNTGEVLNDYVVYDISLVKDGEEVQPDGPVTVSLKVPLDFGDKVSVSRQREDGTWQLIEATVKNGIVTFEIDHFCRFIIGNVVGSFNITEPSKIEIRHKDGIKLHASIEGTAPAGSYVVWTANNGNFKTEEINNGNSLKIVSDKNGTTTFTATLYSEDGETLATDTIEMKSKAGFFDKIGSFFRSLFGGTKLYEN